MVVAAVAAVASAAMNYSGQRRNAKAMRKYNEQMIANQKTALMYRNRGILTQLRQAEDAYAEDKMNAKLKNVQARGQAMTAAADSGGGGNSLQSIGNALGMDLSRNLETIQSSLEATRAVAAEQIQGNQYNTESSMQANMKSTSVDPMSSVMQGVQTGLSVYSMGGGFSAGSTVAATQSANQVIQQKYGNSGSNLLIGGNKQ